MNNDEKNKTEEVIDEIATLGKKICNTLVSIGIDSLTSLIDMKKETIKKKLIKK